MLSLYQRSTTLDINRNKSGDFYDSSLNSRYAYFISALQETTPNLLLIGNGPTGSSLMWYDGGISILLVAHPDEGHSRNQGPDAVQF